MENRRFDSALSSLPENGSTTISGWAMLIASPGQTFFFPGDAISYIGVFEDYFTVVLRDGSSRFTFYWAQVNRMIIGEAAETLRLLGTLYDYMLNPPGEEAVNEKE